MGNIVLLIIGIGVLVLSFTNLRGDASTIHWYNRTKVSQENLKTYAKIMGIGTFIMGFSFVVNSILLMIFEIEKLYYISLGGIGIGILIMLFAQIKYNKGIF